MTTTRTRSRTPSRPAAARTGTRAQPRAVSSRAGSPARPHPAARPTRRPPARPVRRTPPVADPCRRLRGGLVVVGVVVLVLAARLVQLQGMESTVYAAKAEQQRVRKVPLAAQRGAIVDRDGVPLAMNVETRSLYANPRLVSDPRGTAERLAPLIGVPVAELESKLSRDKSFVYLARDVDPEKARAVLALRPQVAGIGAEPSTRRVYPNAALGAAVIGFVGRDGSGLGGVEYSMQAPLAGQSGSLLVEEDEQGREIPSGERRETAPTPGTTQVLTIDRDIQWMAEKTLSEQVAKSGAKGGTAIVMDVRTGEILALATTPTFDPNRATAAPPELRGNPAVSSVYEPGSVNKVITAAAALESGLVTPTSTIVVPTSIRVADKTFTDVHSNGVQRMTFTGVIAKSSNVGTIAVAEQLGRAKVYEYLRKFGFGEKTGVRFPGESAGILPRPEDWSGSQAGTIPIGQGVAATSLQIASVYATVANDGVRVTPSVVRGSRDASGHLVPAAAPRKNRVVSSRTATQLARMLEAVTNEGGTATAARIDGYRVAGKTGTARKVGANGRYDGTYISSFVGFAPAEAPRLVVSVSLDEPGVIFGGVVAAPVFGKLMSFSLGAMRIPPTGRVAEPPVPLLAP
ncbi:MAG TPA: penicillin-binding protein 2 [Mycobacteriales bacterium]|nr:penicillin-binding protein 2 [Mycobacteriales bacterium]